MDSLTLSIVSSIIGAIILGIFGYIYRGIRSKAKNTYAEKSRPFTIHLKNGAAHIATIRLTKVEMMKWYRDKTAGQKYIKEYCGKDISFDPIGKKALRQGATSRDDSGYVWTVDISVSEIS